MQHTVTSLATLIAGHMESDQPDQLLAALKPLNGQLITTRMLDKLPGGRVEWRIARDMGFTSLKNRAYKRHDSAGGIDLTLARSEASAALDVGFVERENPQYFEGRRKRNAQRAAAIADKPTLTRLAFVMNEIEDLNAKLALAHTQFAAFVTSDDSNLYPERYALERACGMRKDVA